MKDYKCVTYDMNNQGAFQCLAIAKTEEARKELIDRGYIEFFTPEKDKINCWVLFRDKSEVFSVI